MKGRSKAMKKIAQKYPQAKVPTQKKVSVKAQKLEHAADNKQKKTSLAR